MELIACIQRISLFKSMNCVSFILSFNELNEHYLKEMEPREGKNRKKGKGRKLWKSLLIKKATFLYPSCTGYGAPSTRESPHRMPFVAPP